MLIFDTIVSLATPRMTSALAIVRLSGTKALDLLDKVINSDAFSLEKNHAYLRKIYHDGKRKEDLIDEAIITIFRAPNSYTGFDLVEFSLHGSMLIVDELVEVLCSYGARVAKKGEFTYQAYYNNKLSLLQSEKINELIHAKSTLSMKLAVNGISSKSHEFINVIKEDLLKISSSIEYLIEEEFISDEELNSELTKIKTQDLTNLLNKLSNLINETKKASQIFNGIKICLIGEPNVGKSTLLNRILNYEKAIVTSVPGTTRDVVEGETYYKGIYFKIYDTAGIRETEDYIESLGINKSKEMINSSDVVLLLSEDDFDIFNELKNIDLTNKLVLKIKTKGDLNKQTDKKKDNLYDLQISYKDDNVNELFDLILSKLNLTESKQDYKDHLTSRELNYLISIQDKLFDFNQLPNNSFYLNIMGDLIIQSIDIFNEMIGKSKGQTKEDVYNSIFSSFCLGK